MCKNWASQRLHWILLIQTKLLGCTFCTELWPNAKGSEFAAIHSYTLYSPRRSELKYRPSRATAMHLRTGFINFYRRFIYEYLKLALLLNALKKKGAIKFSFSELERKAFRALKESFYKCPVLWHFNPTLPITIQMDASDFAILGILL